MINDSTDHEIHGQLDGKVICLNNFNLFQTDEWRQFYVDKVSVWKKLFNRKLCSTEHVVEEIQDIEENNENILNNVFSFFHN